MRLRLDYMQRLLPDSTGVSVAEKDRMSPRRSFQKAHRPALCRSTPRLALPDSRFADAAKQAANSTELTAILDEVFRSQPLPHWREALDRAHITYGVVHQPQDVINDPQLPANDIIVPLEGAGERLKLTVSSPIKVHGVSKVPARRAPDLGEHNEEVLKLLGFTSDEVDTFRTNGAIPQVRHLEATTTGGGE